MAPRHQRRNDNADDADDGTVQRYDRGMPLRAPRRQDNGTLLVEGRIAKPGILRYVDANGKITRELLTAEALHDPASIATLARVAVTLEHPADDVTPDNVERLGVGDIDGQIKRDDIDAVRADLAIRRRDAITAVESGKQELSPGYRVIIDQTPGDHPLFGRYDAIQRNRRYNHVAIVDAARGGQDIRLRADAARQITTDNTPAPRDEMNPLLIAMLATLGADTSRFDTDDAGLAELRRRTDGLAERADAADTAAASLATATANLAAVTAERDTATTDLATMTGERDTLTARVDAIDKAAQAAADTVEREGLGALVDLLKVDGVTDATPLADIRKAVAAKHLDGFGATLPDDADDGYVRGVLASIPKTAAKADAADKPAARSPWSKLSTPAKGADGKRADEASEADADATANYYNRADAAFAGARAGGAA